MTSENEIHVGKSPNFDGNIYDYWKVRMTSYLKALNRKIWRIVLMQKSTHWNPRASVRRVTESQPSVCYRHKVTGLIYGPKARWA